MHCREGLFPIRSTLTNILTQLPQNFIQIHRSVIVNINFITSINYDCKAKKYFINHNNQENLVISDGYIEEFMKNHSIKKFI